MEASYFFEMKRLAWILVMYNNLLLKMMEGQPAYNTRGLITGPLL